MSNFNKVILIGRLTRDPETRATKGGTMITQIGLAVNTRIPSKTGEATEKTGFFDCIAFGKTGEALAKYLKKADPLFIEGRLEYQKWEGNDGTPRTKIEVVVENFQFLSGPGRQEAGAGGKASAPKPKREAEEAVDYGDLAF